MRLRSSKIRRLQWTLSLAILNILGIRAMACQADVSAWPKVSIEMMVSNLGGSPVLGLGSEAIQITENNHSINVESFMPLTEPQSVCVLMDVSSSMKKPLPLVRSGAARLLTDLPKDDEVCVATFDVKLHIDKKLTLNRNDAVQALTKTDAGGGSALFGSVAQLSDYLVANSRFKSRLVVVYSDGDDNYSHISLAALVTRLRSQNNLQVDMVQLPTGRRVQPGERSAFGLGGLVYLPTNAREIEQWSGQLARATRCRYTLTYSASDQSRDGKERHLNIGLGTLKASVSAPEGYYAPSQ